MKKQNSKPEEAALLRQKAEELLHRRDKACLVSTSATEPDLQKLIYELEVHQIELEMQNEELLIAKEKAELAQEKYTHLYDFASSGYISLSKKGEILELNFAAAQMLGKERSHLIKKRFEFFVSVDTQTTFDLFLLNVFTSKVKLSCEVIIATEGNLPIYVNIDGIVSQNNELCILTLNDITESKKSAINLFEAKELAEESEIRFRNLSENSPGIIYRILLNPSLKFEYVSPAVTKITGYTPEDHYADPDLGFKLVHPDDRIILENSTHKTQGEPVILRWVKKDGKIIWTEQRNVLIFDSEGNPFAIEGIATDITVQKEAEQELKRIEWLLTSRPEVDDEKYHLYMPPYGDLVALNTSRLILDSVGKQTLTDIVGDYLNMLDTSSAVYEKNGDYALGIFSSGWCRFMDAASRKGCGTDDNRTALDCGKWHCHESCWSRASKTAIESGQPADIECDGGIRLYAAPIRVGDEIVGAINFGYGDPPRDERKLRELATLYQVSYDELRTHALNYESRPPYIIDLAKNRLQSSARLIGEIIERKQAELLIQNKSEEIAAQNEELNQANLELNKARETTLQSEERFHLAMKASHDGLFDWNLETNEIYYSPGWKKMLGYADHELPNDFSVWEKTTEPEDAKKSWELQQKLITKQTDRFVMEFKMKHKDGHWVDILSRAEAIFNDNGKAIRIVGTHTDITERKQAEQTLINSQTLFTAFMANNPAAGWITDRNGLITYASPGYSKMFPTGDPTGRSVFSLYPEPIAREYVANNERVLAANSVEELTESGLRADGSPGSFHVYKFPVPSLEGNLHIGGTALDITERMQAEILIKNYANRLELTMESASMAWWEMDIHTGKVIFNRKKTDMIGYSQEQFHHYTDFTRLVHPDDYEPMMSSMRALLEETEGKYDCEYRIKAKSGEYIWFHDIGTITGRTKKGEPLTVSGIVLNITERKLAEEEIKKTGQYYQALIEKAPDGIALIGAEGNFKYISPAAKKMFGFLQTDEVSGNPAEHTHPDDLQMVLSELGKILVDPAYSPTLEYRFIDKSGHWHWVETTFSNLLANPSLESIVLNFHDITDRKHAEEKLRKSEERYALGIEASEQGIWDWNVETNEIFYSEQWKKQIGYEDDELKNEFNTWVEHLHPDEKEYCQNTVLSYLSQPVAHFILDFRFRHKDGTYRWIHNKAASIKNLEGKVIRLFGTHTDITETKLSEAIFKDIIEKNPMSIQILDMEGYPIQVNPAHTKLFGVEVPLTYSFFKDSQLLALGFGELFDRIRNGEVVNFPDSYYNVHDVDPSFPDSPVWVKALGFTLNDISGNPNKIVLMHENITERKNAEALLNDIIENNPLSIQVVDKEGYTQRGNPAFIDLFGSVPPPQFSIFDDLKSKGPELGNLVSLVKKGEIVHLPDIYFNAHDTVAEAPDIPLWIRALIFPLNDSSGKPERFVFMHENITERKFAEQELIKSKEHAEESDRLKSAFLANMSHEIRTPMNGILGFSELLKEPGLTGEQQQEYIRIIEKSGARMLNIINDIVDISKIEAGLIKLDISESNVNEQIEFIYTFFKPEVEAKGMKLSFRNSLTAKEALIKTDREKLYAILTNLVKNAIKYTNEGSIEFGYQHVVETGHALSLPQKSFLQFYVKDTGIGIPKDRQEAIFHRFIQADITDKMARQGAGLGLSISKAYVEMLGGKIWVESDPNSDREGIGSTFYFTLPYHSESGKETIDGQPATSEKNETVRKLKILIAEDDEVSEMLIDSYIRLFGKEILKAKTGVEAVEVCRENPDLDLILMDIRMPEMGGYEATKQIRQFNENVVILAQTAFGLSGDREKAIKSGCNDYIAKPINKSKLLALIQKHFGK
jgi:PAS domain S-box-containing protein